MPDVWPHPHQTRAETPVRAVQNQGQHYELLLLVVSPFPSSTTSLLRCTLQDVLLGWVLRGKKVRIPCRIIPSLLEDEPTRLSCHSQTRCMIPYKFGSIVYSLLSQLGVHTQCYHVR